MTHAQLENLNIESFTGMPTPEEIHTLLPLSDKAAATVADGRATMQRILDRQDPRLFVVVGPCSIHDPLAGMDYAKRLKKLSDEVADTLVLVATGTGTIRVIRYINVLEFCAIYNCHQPSKTSNTADVNATINALMTSLWRAY